MKRNTKSGTRIQEQRKEQGRNEDNRENKGRNKRNKGGKHLPHCNEGVGKSQRNKGIPSKVTSNSPQVANPLRKSSSAVFKSQMAGIETEYNGPACKVKAKLTG